MTLWLSNEEERDYSYTSNRGDGCIEEEPREREEKDANGNIGVSEKQHKEVAIKAWEEMENLLIPTFLIVIVYPCVVEQKDYVTVYRPLRLSYSNN